jgi:hypothetical protein
MCERQAAQVKVEVSSETYVEHEQPTIFHALLDADKRREAGKREIDVATVAAVGLLLVGAAIEVRFARVLSSKSR